MKKTELLDVLEQHPNAILATNRGLIIGIDRYDSDAPISLEDANWSALSEECNPDGTVEMGREKAVRACEVDVDSLSDTDPMMVLTFDNGYVPIRQVTIHPSEAMLILHAD